MNNYRLIDESEWKRREHCAVFRNYTEPAFCVTFEADVTRFLQYVRQNRFSFTLSLIYISAKCANEIEEFRYRFLDGQVVLFDQIDTAFTWLDGQTELFKVVRVPFLASLREYVAAAGEAAEKQREYFTGPLYFSFLPCRGSATRIFRTPFRANATPPRPCSIGANTANAAEKFYCPIRCRFTTPSPTVCTSQNLHRNSKPPSILPEIEPKALRRSFRR